MNRFGLPLVPAALALWVINLIDRLFINAYKGQAEVGIYSLAVRIASVIVFLMTAFQLAWPAFAYSIRDDDRGQAHLRLRPHLPALHHLLDVARARLARPLDRRHPRAARGTSSRSAEAVPLLCFASPRTPATPCSRSASAGCARPSSTGSSAASRRSSTSA